jgi:hypothetical protein
MSTNTYAKINPTLFNNISTNNGEFNRKEKDGGGLIFA